MTSKRTLIIIDGENETHEWTRSLVTHLQTISDHDISVQVFAQQKVLTALHLPNLECITCFPASSNQTQAADVELVALSFWHISCMTGHKRIILVAGCDKRYIAYEALLRNHFKDSYVRRINTNKTLFSPDILDDNSSEAFLPLAAVTAKRLPYTCSKCYEEFKSRNKLDKHRQTHKPQISCPHPGCTFTHTKQSKVNQHVKRCDLHKTVYQCSVCPRKPFDTPTGLD